jgi:hypothetical protein
MSQPTIDEHLDAHAWRVMNEPLPDGVRHSEEHYYWASLRLQRHPYPRIPPGELRIARFFASRRRSCSW